MGTLSKFFSALLSAIMAKEASVGASVMAGLAAIGIGWAQAELKIVADAQTHFHDAYTAEKAKGTDFINAVENAATATLNTFCADETALMSTEIKALVVLWQSSAKAAEAALGV